MTEPVAPAYWCGHFTRFKHNNACMSEIYVLTQSFSSHELRFIAASSSTQKIPPSGRTPRPVADRHLGVMPPGRTLQEKGSRQQRHGPYTHI